MIAGCHAKYYAHELVRTSGSGVDRIGMVLFDACVGLNPHQIEVALFALQSPISKGALLADEVGLGKTIEPSSKIIRFHERIKDVEKRLNDLSVVLNSFILSWTKFPRLKWDNSQAQLEEKHFLSMADDRDHYVE
jgi:hypothetical protein